MSTALFDHPYISGLLGDAEMAPHLNAESQLAAMLRFETELAMAQAVEGVIPETAASAIVEAIDHLTLDFNALRAGVERDGVVVPALVAELRAATGGKHGRHVHFGATSQDLIDTAQALALKEIVKILERRLADVLVVLDELHKRDGKTKVMAHTRMQAAIPVTAARKIESWRDPLIRQNQRLTQVRNDLLVLHYGGAAGTLDKLTGSKGPAVRARLAKRLGLRDIPRARHSERDGLANFASWLSVLTGSLGKMGQDIALLAQSEVGEIVLASGGGSSAMPHKVNPIGAELLVTFARFNATLLSAMHHALVHENERSGAAWTLERMVLPQMTVAAGAALRTAAGLIGSLSFRPTA
ncbi:MAG: 3-carboxy-cis,cis-muconate cycloisomerase [Rhizobiaceae bacterium]|nr:3-carboxy-cis,cis-muconate cycloisomerase [Rhizobiaceae bacterium]